MKTHDAFGQVKDWEFGLDYETFSSVPLGKKEGRGLPNYIASPDFRVLCVSVSVPIIHKNKYTDVWEEFTWDFVFNVLRRRGLKAQGKAMESFKNMLDWYYDRPFMAHNASFERAVTNWLFPDFDPFRFQDSAVDARMMGAESKLEVASRQLTSTGKMEVGEELIQLFCVPNEQYPEGPTPELIEQHGHMELWLQFIEYCEVDAKAGREIRKTARRFLDRFHPGLIEREALFEQCTWEMNQAGWGVDLKLVNKMHLRAWANGVLAERAFQVEDAEGNSVQINFNSHPQLKKFCAERGVTYKSLDKYHLPAVLKRVKTRIAKLNEELKDGDYPTLKRELSRLEEVEMLLETKAEIGGSTLTKLPTILRLVSDDGILRDQYVHVGASQTFRSTGRGVQMQNLKKLDGNIRDTSTLYAFEEHWSNGDMAGQLRQVFRSRHPEGEIIVGDFAGVESRGLAYEAGEEWKLQTFREGKDVYCMLVTRFIPGLTYEEVSDKNGPHYQTLRPRGKYSELSCGFQASAKALQDFMFRLGFSISIEEAMENVNDWRRACPAIVDYWALLDDLLKDSVRSNMMLEAQLGYGMSVRVTPFALDSVQEQHPGATSLCLQILVDGEPYVTRFVHGCYFSGRQLRYYKPVQLLSKGILWNDIDETRTSKARAAGEIGEDQELYYGIYGGKLAGIFTQSLCRELFFDSLLRLRNLLKGIPNAVICGQFHDEINVDWWPSTEPGAKPKEWVIHNMREAMKHVERLRDFPLDVDIKSAYRYIK